MPRLTGVDAAPLSYDVHGVPGRDRTVVLVHGWMVTAEVWRSLVDALPGHAFVVPHLRGTGASTPVEAGSIALARFADDLARVIAHVGVGPVDLLGHSMGGQIAALACAERPSSFRSLVLVNPVPTSGLPLPPEADGLFRTAGGDAGKLGTILDMACKSLGPAARASLVESAVGIDAEVVLRGYEAWTTGTKDVDLGRITCPTLVVATDDPFLPPPFLESAVASAIASAKVVHLRGPGHYPQVEATEALAEVLRAFWSPAE